MINLNKRFIRIATTIVTFFFMVGVFVRRQSEGSQLLSIPALGHRPKSHSPSPETYDFSTTSSFSPVNINPTDVSVQELCDSFPKHLLNYVQPILKMGYGENRAKVDAQLESVSACFNGGELLVFSDLDESVRGHNVIDVLADLPAPYFNLTQHPHMQHYIWQRTMRANGTLGNKGAKKIDGWILDKYKFLPMIERAWITKPNKPFYFFYETDTYVFWDNLFRFLQTFDPDVPLYMGSPSPGRADPRSKKQEATWFANGGPGFVLSRGAIKALLKREVGPSGQYIDPPLAEKWLDLLQMECCGDSVVGYTLWDANVPLQGYWPLFNPHPLHGVPFSDPYWCQPVLTLHKTMPHDMTDLWKWEFSQRRHDRPLLYADLWGFQHPGQKMKQVDWDNGDWDRWDVPDDIVIESAAQCERYCKSQPRCLQWNWRGRDEKRCIPMGSMRQGRQRLPERLPTPKPEKDENGKVIVPKTKPTTKHVDFTAGWVQSRVREWRAKHQCVKPQWVGPSTKRIF